MSSVTTIRQVGGRGCPGSTLGAHHNRSESPSSLTPVLSFREPITFVQDCHTTHTPSVLGPTLEVVYEPSDRWGVPDDEGWSD